MSPVCRQTEQAIEQAFLKRDLRPLAAVREHLAGCDACRALYDRAFEAGAALGQPDADAAGLSLTEREMLLAAVLPVAERPRWVRLLPQLSAAAAACALIIWVALLPPPPPRQGLTARGPGQAHTLEGLGVRALCLVRPACTADGSAGSDLCAAKPVKIHSLPPRPLAGERPRCSRRDALGFAYRNETGQPWYLQLAVVAPDGTIELVSVAAQPLAPTTGDRPLEATLELGQVGAGRLSIVALFSRRALPAGAVLNTAREMNTARKAGTSMEGGRILHLVAEIGE